MRAVLYLPLSCLFASVIALVACSSDPAPPEIDPGKETEEGGVTTEGGTIDSNQSAAYPDGPYGYEMGQIVGDFLFSGLMNPKAVSYVADNTTLKPIALHDFYNPSNDPNRARVMLMTWSARWCSVCQTQAGGSAADSIPSAMEEYATWHPQRVEFMEAMFENIDSDPAQPSDLAAWTKTYHFEFPSVLDSDLQSSGVTFNRSAAPYNMVIDLKYMKITYAKAGLFMPADAEAEFTSVLNSP